jgi:hypothetical protein
VQHWYVYYKLPHGELAAVAQRVRAMQADLAAATGVQARLVRRVAEPQDGDVTLMEVYERIAHPARFQSAYDLAVAAADFRVELAAARRVERFEDF